MEAILGQVQAVMGHRTTDRLHGIAAPTLVITGDADLLVPPANSDVLARHIPGARLVKVPGRSYYQTLRDKLRWGIPPNYRTEPPAA